MSESYKRELVRTWCAAVTAAPFVATVNLNDRPPVTAPTWWTIEWRPDRTEPLAFGGLAQETGLLAVIVGGEPNQGDDAVAAASAAIVGELLAMADPESALTLERAQATEEHSAGTADRYYRLSTPIEYRFISGGT